MNTVIPARKHPLAKCEECPLCNSKRIAPTHGPANAKIAVVSRSPGRYDVAAKKPFAGPSGKVLNHLLSLYGVHRDEILTTNLVLCGTDDPPKEAIRACSPRLQSDLQDCSTIIAAGAEAVAELTDRKSLSGARGYVHERRSLSGRNQRIIAANNPAVVLRDDSTFPNLIKDFRLALSPLPPPVTPTVRWTNDVGEAKYWLESISNKDVPLLTCDIETKGLRIGADIVAVGFAAGGDKAISIGELSCRDESCMRDYIAPLITKSGDSRYLYHNGKFDVRILRSHGVSARVDEDTMLLSWALDERSDEEQVHKLEYLLMNELGWPNYEPKEVRDYKSAVRRLEKELKFDELAALEVPDELYKYNALDAAGTAQLFPILKERAINDNVWDMYRRYLIPASEALVKVELHGIGYDADAACDLLEEEVWPALDQLKAELRLIVGKNDYNPNSPQQNAQLVYDEWCVIHNLRLKNDRSVDKSVYTVMKKNEFVIGGGDIETKEKRKETAVRWANTYADFKSLDKQRSTYIEGLIPRAIYNGNRLYTNFKLHNTVSGRLSSSEPNLQNITRTKPGLPNIRALFTASPGRILLNADYSQAELRAIGELSGDSEFARIYREGIDFHALVAERFYGPQYTKENRQTAKNVNFGVAFLQSAETFQEKHDIPVSEAKPFIEWWWKQFPAVRDWTNQVASEVRKGEVVSPFGNKRRFHLLTKENINAAIREGINFLPQNIAAFLTVFALVNVVAKLDPNMGAVNLNVHDSILVDTDPNYLDVVGRLVRNEMEAAPKATLGWDFPFAADLQIGQNWGNLQDYELEKE